jgi:hypothetical protein
VTTISVVARMPWANRSAEENGVICRFSTWPRLVADVRHGLADGGDVAVGRTCGTVDQRSIVTSACAGR